MLLKAFGPILSFHLIDRLSNLPCRNCQRSSDLARNNLQKKFVYLHKSNLKVLFNKKGTNLDCNISFEWHIGHIPLLHMSYHMVYMALMTWYPRIYKLKIPLNRSNNQYRVHSISLGQNTYQVHRRTYGTKKETTNKIMSFFLILKYKTTTDLSIIFKAWY